MGSRGCCLTSLLMIVAFGLALTPVPSARSITMADYDNSPTIGPARGWLVISGGGGAPPEVNRLFVSLAGGPAANLVVIPTAQADSDIDLEQMRQSFSKRFGVAHVTLLHTRDRVRANSDGFVEPLRHATGVWFDGGRQWRLADAYLGTAVEREIKALLARGGVVGGGSAGASIQASYLVRGAPEGHDMMMSPGHEVGFALLSNSAIDQHVNTRGREKDLDSVIAAHPELLGIGIDEKTAIVVHGDSFKVIGIGQVAIHDGKQHDGTLYYSLSAGQTFNLRTREVENPSASSPSHNSPSLNGGSQGDKYPLILTVTSASRRTGKSGTTTTGTGVLTSKEDPSKPPENVNFECDTGVFSRAGKNVYPARVHKPFQLKIAAREIGSDKVQEFTCKY